ncbi:MAG: GH3 auxin-responsive promoter family protein [Gammaproteobacteria bacterium]
MSNAWLSRAGHLALRAAVLSGHYRFIAGSHDLERVQRARLASLLCQVSAVDGRMDSRWRWEDFCARVPVTTWRDWQPMVDRQRETHQRLLIDSPVERYQPTSGSTSAIKWIPYTRQLLAEFDAAISPWLGDLYRAHPGVRRGHHYWSLSWLPTSMRAGQHGELNDDMTLLSSGKRILTQVTQAVPSGAALAPTSDGSLWVTLAYLAADRQLSAISVWSPTFALNLLERMGDWRQELAEMLERGDWRARVAHAGPLPCPRSPRSAALLRAWSGVPDAAFFAELWPQLALVSAWDTAGAEPWAQRLRMLLAHAAFQGKGLWATEGALTIPFRGQHTLAYRSHVVEFEDLDSGLVLAPWQLREGQQVSPLISTGSGLLRYRMNDILRVGGHFGSVPTLEFMGRDDGCDLVGEKIGSTFAQAVIEKILDGSGLLPVTLLALDDAGRGRPGYVLLLDDEQDGMTETRKMLLAGRLERALCRHFHYELARSLGQLDIAHVACAPGLRRTYADLCRFTGMIDGNIKMEPLRRWRGGQPVALMNLLAASVADATPVLRPKEPVM